MLPSAFAISTSAQRSSGTGSSSRSVNVALTPRSNVHTSDATATGSHEKSVSGIVPPCGISISSMCTAMASPSGSHVAGTRTISTCAARFVLDHVAGRERGRVVLGEIEVCVLERSTGRRPPAIR